MRYVHIDTVEQGQLLGRTIFSSTGTTLLAGGVQLTVYMINTLQRIGVTMLYIKDPVFEDVVIADLLSEETKRVVLKNMAETFNSIRSGKEFTTKNINVSVDHLLEDVMRNKELLVQLTDIRTEDNALYIHSLNVAMMSVLIGVNLNLSQSQLKELAIGALLHDIGKVGAERSDDPKELQDVKDLWDLKKHHTWKGFEILKNKREYSLMIAHIAFQHHETPDGKGVPRGMEDEQIHLFAKIVAVANLFDNLLFDLNSGKSMLPHEACERLMALVGTKVDHGVVLQFLKTVSVYPTGSSVRLSTRETGVVVGQHRGLPGRPIIRVINSEEDEEITVKEIDLAIKTTVFVVSVLA